MPVNSPRRIHIADIGGVKAQVMCVALLDDHQYPLLGSTIPWVFDAGRPSLVTGNPVPIWPVVGMIDAHQPRQLSYV